MRHGCSIHAPLTGGRRTWQVLVACVIVACAAGAFALGAGRAAHGVRIAASPPAVGPPSGPPPTAARPPNIVFVLTDDFSIDLLRFMPQLQRVRRQGLSFDNFFVADSLCCPSRASILTGDFPHDTRIFHNVAPNGGFQTFFTRGEERRTFAVALRRAGYLTAMMGKYLNGYMQAAGEYPGQGFTTAPKTYVPPGWDEWDVVGWGYPEYDYTMNVNGRLRRFGHRPADYLTDVLARRGVRFINAAARTGKPFFLELATFAPHDPYEPAPRHAGDFPGLRAPRPPSFDARVHDPPPWLEGRRPLSTADLSAIDAAYRRQAESVQAIDDLIGRVRAALRARGLAQDTFLFFSSDNGLHMGEYRLLPGKLTAFDTDVHVPLIVSGPGVARGAHTAAMAENIDLAETFTSIGGARLSDGDGRSLLPILTGAQPAGWRNAILIEYDRARRNLDPDFQLPPNGTPPSYAAIRTPTSLYVEDRDGEREFYDLRSDPFELHNIYDRLSPRALRALHRQLSALVHCHTAAACWRAMQVSRVGPA